MGTGAFSGYRKKLGFTSQEATEVFLRAKDIVREPDLEYVMNLTQRVEEIVRSVDAISFAAIQQDSIDDFVERSIFQVFGKVQQNQLWTSLNNNGRSAEEVYFSWIRGYALAELMRHALAVILGVADRTITKSGADNFDSAETFKKTSDADYELNDGGLLIKFEIQCGFQGRYGDIKKSKFQKAASEAQNGFRTLAVHHDVFNGRVAVIRLDGVDLDSVNWTTRYENTMVKPISDHEFMWNLSEPPPSKDQLLLL